MTHQPGHFGDDLSAYLAENNISPGGGTAPVADDPPVWTGETRKVRRPPLDRAFEEGIPGTRSLYGPIFVEPEQGVRPLSEVLADFYQWDAKKVRAFQEKAYSAGLLGASRDGVAWGVQGDDDTFRAWRTIAMRSASFYGAGRKLTPTQVLDMAAEANLGDAGGGGRTVVLPNPIDARANLEQQGTATLGRSNVGDADFDAFFAQLQAHARAAQSGEGTVTAPPSIAATAERYLRDTHPVEAQSHDLAVQFDRFLAMILGGPS